MQRLTENHGSNNLVDSLLQGEMTLDKITDKEIQAWLRVMQQTSTNMTLPKIEGAISVKESQQAFKIVKERTLSSPSSLHYYRFQIN